MKTGLSLSFELNEQRNRPADLDVMGATHSSVGPRRSNDLVATANRGTEGSAADVQCTPMRSVTSATGAAPTRDVPAASGSDRDETVKNGFCRAD